MEKITTKNFKQKFIDTAYSKFGVKANGIINFEQAFAIIDEIEQCDHETGKISHDGKTWFCLGCNEMEAA